MESEELELDFEFSDEELANFLENFADKLGDDKVGLSFKGRKEIEVESDEPHQLELDFERKETTRRLSIEIQLSEEIEITDDGREKIQVKVV